jgi:CheY-like chemotaxis protein
VVLVVDDEPAITEIFCNALACPEINVVAPIDIFMPGIGGIEGIRLMKERFANCKLISMSGGWSDLRAEHALKAVRKIGADEVLGKPFDLPDVRSLVGRMVERIIGEEGETAAGAAAG